MVCAFFSFASLIQLAVTLAGGVRVNGRASPPWDGAQMAPSCILSMQRRDSAERIPFLATVDGWNAAATHRAAFRGVSSFFPFVSLEGPSLHLFFLRLRRVAALDGTNDGCGSIWLERADVAGRARGRRLRAGCACCSAYAARAYAYAPRTAARRLLYAATAPYCLRLPEGLGRKSLLPASMGRTPY